jgi:hypothetical protein
VVVLDEIREVAGLQALAGEVVEPDGDSRLLIRTWWSEG